MIAKEKQRGERGRAENARSDVADGGHLRRAIAVVIFGSELVATRVGLRRACGWPPERGPDPFRIAGERRGAERETNADPKGCCRQPNFRYEQPGGRTRNARANIETTLDRTGNPGCLARLFPVGLELDLVRFARIDEKRLRERRGSDGLTVDRERRATLCNRELDRGESAFHIRQVVLELLPLRWRCIRGEMLHGEGEVIGRLVVAAGLELGSAQVRGQLPVREDTESRLESDA